MVLICESCNSISHHMEDGFVQVVGRRMSATRARGRAGLQSTELTGTTQAPLPREGLDGSEGSQTKTLFTGFGLWDRSELSNHTGQRVGMGC